MVYERIVRSNEASPERLFHQRLLGEIRPLMENALLEAGIPPDDINWVERKHDMVDLTATWPKERPSRSIHTTLTGNGPTRFPVEAEGHVWEDDEERLERMNIRVFPFPVQGIEPPGVVVVSGMLSDPAVTIVNKDELLDGMRRLAKDVVTAIPGVPGMSYPLEPDPRR